MAIKAIIFDFGNVLFDLDFEGCYNRFYSTLGLENTFPDFPDDLAEVFFGYEKHAYSEADMLAIMQKYAPDITLEHFKTLWNSLLVGMPKERISWLERIGKKHDIYLLSNINTWHREAIDEFLLEQYGIQHFERTYFKQHFYSYEMGLRKPELAIYKKVEDALDVPNHEILFIDDNQANITAAKQRGWNTILHLPATPIEIAFEGYLK